MNNGDENVEKLLSFILYLIDVAVNANQKGFGKIAVEIIDERKIL